MSKLGNTGPSISIFDDVHAGGAEARSFLFFSTKRKIGKISKSLKRLSYKQRGEERRGEDLVWRRSGPLEGERGEEGKRNEIKACIGRYRGERGTKFLSRLSKALRKSVEEREPV